MRIVTALSLAVLCCGLAQAGQFRFSVYVNAGIDTANADVSQVIRLWESYLNSNPDSTYDNPYWLDAEKRRYKAYDFLNVGYFSPSLYHFLPYWKATVMSVAPADSGFFIRTLFATATESGFSSPMCIAEVGASKVNGTYKLRNVLPLKTADWLREKVGSITFIFPPDHQFDRELAQRMNDFVDSLTTVWGIKPIDTEFYLADDLGEIMKIRGFDYYVGEGYNQGPGGITNVANHIVFGGGMDEWYPHEFVHVYINPLFPKAHNYFLEGYAALIGGSKGHDLSWHMKRMQTYLEEHPELNLNNLLAFWHFDAATDPQYVFGGLICKLVLQEHGMDGLKRLFSFGKEEEDFYRAIESLLGVKQEELNSFLRENLAEYASH